MGTPIDGAVGRGFGMTGGGGVRGNLAADNSGGRVEMVFITNGHLLFVMGALIL